MTGGAGADRLVLGSGRDHVMFDARGEGGDTIENFVTSQDQIDLGNLFAGVNGASANPSLYVKFAQSGADTRLSVDMNGDTDHSMIDDTFLGTLKSVQMNSLVIGRDILMD
jgi:Ca2+-binding RTX toxin-like protein